MASWLGNWELDVVAEDEAFAQEMERMYLDDLSRVNRNHFEIEKSEATRATLAARAVTDEDRQRAQRHNQRDAREQYAGRCHYQSPGARTF